MVDESKRMRTPISYYGGKQRMAPKIVALMPKHTVYVEPFFGGGAVFFAKHVPPVTNSIHYREVINDKDSRVVNFFRELQKSDSLERMIANTPYSREVYREACDVYKTNATGERAAWAFYVALNMSFSNKACAGWTKATVGMNHTASFANKSKHVGEFKKRLCGAYIENKDATEVIGMWDSPQTLFYCDPPYPGADQGHYGGYTVEHLQRLVDVLDSCEGAFMLSNYNQPGINFPESWERFDFAASASAALNRNGSGNGSRTESVWYRPRKGDLRPDIEKIMQSPAFDCFNGGAVRARGDVAS